MAFQKSVNAEQAFGMVGEMYDDSPRTIAPMLVGGTSGKVVVGNAVSFADKANDPSICVLGGTAYAGIVVAGKQYVAEGIGATLDVPFGKAVDVCAEGHVVVAIDGDATVGSKVEFSAEDGSLKILAGTAADAGYTELAGAQVVLVNGGGTNGKVVLELNRNR